MNEWPVFDRPNRAAEWPFMQKLGAISKKGERTLRRLLIIGSSAVVLQASERGASAGSWLEGMLARKPRTLVTVALANKMARTAWHRC
jgi:transposase